MHANQSQTFSVNAWESLPNVFLNDLTKIGRLEIFTKDFPERLRNRYGYRGWDTRKNLWVVRSGEMLYYVAAVAVLYDRNDDRQRHYTGHTEDIMWWGITPVGGAEWGDALLCGGGGGAVR